ncbi:uncharacterized protein ycf45-like isoform X1 [Ananas comosus]|uniref:Uncharacterized protein ycf45-like isoform X1 n=1 Tax=Ananas comosus TaxID=4615 RepID=A0A6P5FN45_ANACO|nr:uncharacterized protein ycf45-like isoform X1 [Ananas comosus]
MLLLRPSLLPPSPTLTLTQTPHRNPSLPTPFPLRSPPPLLLLLHHHSPWRRPRRSSPSPIPFASASDNARPAAVDAAAAAAGFEEELRRLLVLLPAEMRRRVEDHVELLDLVEIVMDLGRRPLARFPSGDFFLSDRPISNLDLRHATSQVGDFAADNRAGISRTLHRISAIRNRKGAIIGLTCRVGRTLTGSANLLRDLVKDGGSLLLIGPPGVGKTTIIREIARMLADDYKKRVMIVDTSNEIGGDGDIPHAGIGGARRLQVPNADMQHKVLIEAVENHMPQVIVIDEIGTKLEAMTASTIAQRGIQLVATAHGVTIESLVMNPSLEMLVGGIQSVTLGDEEASRRGVQKTVLERKGPSTFTCCAEIISKTELRVHRNLEDTVDALLAGRSPDYEVRKSDKNKKGSMHEFVHVQQESFNDTPSKEDGIEAVDYSRWDDRSTLESAVTLDLAEKQIEISHKSERGFALYVYGIMETSVLQAINQLGMDGMVRLTDNISEADGFLALQSKLKKNSHIQAATKSHNIPVFVTKTNSLMQITKALRALVNEHAFGSKPLEGIEKATSSERTDALEEVRLAIEQVVIPSAESVQLLPRPPHIVSAQIELIESFNLEWEMKGQEPSVYLCIFPHQSNIKAKNQVTDDSGDLSWNENLNGSQNGVARLPLLPE